jgi:dynein heavy chain
MGPEYLTPPGFDLKLSFKEAGPTVPIVYIISPGADPIAEIKKLANNMGMSQKCIPMSLGDGQGPKATAAIDNAMEQGLWIVLQNCHLATSYMPILEKRVDDFNPDKIDHAF